MTEAFLGHSDAPAHALAARFESFIDAVVKLPEKRSRLLGIGVIGRATHGSAVILARLNAPRLINATTISRATSCSDSIDSSPPLVPLADTKRLSSVGIRVRARPNALGGGERELQRRHRIVLAARPGFSQARFAVTFGRGHSRSGGAGERHHAVRQRRGEPVPVKKTAADYGIHGFGGQLKNAQDVGSKSA